MEMQFKVILSNKNIYKEVILPKGGASVSVGTDIACDARLPKVFFFEPFELKFLKDGQSWMVNCSDNTYVSTGEFSKFPQKALSHGDELKVKYATTNTEFLDLSFSIDFNEVVPVYDLYIDIRGKNNIVIGGEPQADIYISDPYVGKDKAVLSFQNGSYSIEDVNTRYGVYVNGVRISRKVKLNYYDFFSIAQYSFFLKKEALYTASQSRIRIEHLQKRPIYEQKSQLLYPMFNRSTKLKTVPNSQKITVLDPPAKPEKPQENLVATLFPAITMLVLTVVMRGIIGNGGSYVLFSACTMGLGIVTSVASYFSNKRHYKKDIKERLEKYNAYIEKKSQEIEAAREREQKELGEVFFPHELEERFVEDFSGNLFDRVLGDDDFGMVRLGTGERKSMRQVEFKRQETIEVTDDLTLLPEQIGKKYEKITNAPITVSFAGSDAVGVIGSSEKSYILLENIIYDLCVRHFYSDMQFYFVTDEKEVEKIKWAKWLPHVNNEEIGIRNIVCDSQSRDLIFEYLFVQLSRSFDRNETPERHNVIFVLNDMGMKQHPVAQLIKGAKGKGYTFVFFERVQELLPQNCETVIYLDDASLSGTVLRAKDRTEQMKFAYQDISPGVLRATAIKLAPVFCEEVSLASTLAKSYTFFQMMNIFGADDIDLEHNWSSGAVYRTLRAPLGINAKKETVELDLHEKAHGPHGLVAGTTGSGKSEILQSYILSMAIHYHPYDVGFVIIDFKGGGMANQFRDLPHLIGTITDIDGREIDRSLKSIKAELEKRKRLFAEYGVNKISDYIKKFRQGEAKIALPHLIIIVDEFAELKADQPEFMKELISAARIGRSLGVHLILATQKPSGQVNEQIWSNSKFKLCLKVQTQEDSKEVLKSPLAAEIREPGRAYLQVGNNELFELFQSAYSGGAAKSDDSTNSHEFVLSELNTWGKRIPVYEQKRRRNAEEGQGKTQLEAVVEHVNGYCAQNQIDKLPNICLPPLPKVLEFVSSKGQKGCHLVVDIGIYDDPDNQYQGQVSVDLSVNNLMVIGSSQYGKTNLLQSIIRNLQERYTPAQANLYILDFGSMILKNFEQSNFVGGVVCTSDDEKLKNLFRLIRMEIVQRKDRLVQVGVSSFASYLEAGYQDIPQIIVFVDNYTALKELYMNEEDFLLPICRDGLAVGITVVLANSQTAGIGLRYMSNFSKKIAFYCNDSGEYGSVLERCRMAPAEVPGRGIIEIDKVIYEFQSYLSFPGEKEIDRVKEIRAHVEQVRSKFEGIEAKKIPEVPEVLDYSYAEMHLDDSLRKPYQVPVGINYETVEWVMLDLSKTATIVITGREHFGKTNLLGLFLDYLQQNVFEYPAKAYIFDDYDRQLDPYSSYGFIEKYTVDVGDFASVLSEMETELRERQQALRDGISLESEPLLLCVLQNPEFYRAGGVSKEDGETLKNIVKSYARMKVCFIFANVENAPIGYNAPELLKMVKACGDVFVCDDLANLKFIDFPAGTLKKHKKPVELGDSYYITEKAIIRQKTIHAERSE